VDPDRGQRLAHLVKLEGFYDRDDEFHGPAFSSGTRAGSGGRQRAIQSMPNLSAARAKNKRIFCLRMRLSAGF
jgi:hypothetical protein